MDCRVAWSMLAAAVALCGCRSPYYADQGALFGGLMGAGTGALVGSTVGKAGAGAAIGAGVGALTGAAVGSSLDEIEAKNRAMIAAQLGREVRPGSATIEDVLMMSQAGVDDELIINHIRMNGVQRVPGPHELVTLKQQGVSASVIRAMQEAGNRPPPSTTTTVITRPAPPVIVEEYHYGPPPPCWPPPHYAFRYHAHRRPVYSWGFTFRN